MNIPTRTIALATLALLGVGCESIESTDVSTDAIYADLVATSDGSSTHTTATMRLGGATSNTFVNLEGDDILSVTAGGETQEMQEGYVGDIYIYDADFDLYEADTEFVFSLDRSVDDGAPDSRCSLPEPLDVTAPLGGETFSRELDDLTITWTPSGEQDQIRVIVQGECMWDEVVDVEGDPGTLVITAGTILSLDEDNPAACDASVIVQRRRVGTLDPGYGEGGSIFGVQSREVAFRTDP